MHDPLFLLATCAGTLVALGLLLTVQGLRNLPPRLDDAMALLAGPGATGRASLPHELRADDGDVATRVGQWLFTRLRLPLGERTRRTLALQGRSIGDFVAEKALLAAIGLALPLVLGAMVRGLGGVLAPVPVGASLAGALAGWFWPELALRRTATVVRADAGEALFTFLDLVTLERLANASAPQALASAAAMSDTPVFLRLRGALLRARLEQRPPWQELHRLATELELPQIADVADVMRLDEQGAALAGALRARVAELRDAHLLQEKVAAQQVSERMTLWMVLPSMIFGLVFLAPPILRLLGLDG